MYCYSYLDQQKLEFTSVINDLQNMFYSLYCHEFLEHSQNERVWGSKVCFLTDKSKHLSSY